MNIDVQWDNDQHTIIRQVYHRGWTWDDFSASNDEVVTLMESVPHPVHVIAILTNTNVFPRRPSMVRARHAINKLPDNKGILVVVSDSVAVTSMIDIFKRVYPGEAARNIHVARSLEGAYTIIQKHEHVEADSGPASCQ